MNRVKKQNALQFARHAGNCGSPIWNQVALGVERDRGIYLWSMYFANKIKKVQLSKAAGQLIPYACLYRKLSHTLALNPATIDSLFAILCPFDFPCHEIDIYPQIQPQTSNVKFMKMTCKHISRRYEWSDTFSIFLLYSH